MRLALLGGLLVALTCGGLAAHDLGPLDTEAEARKALFVAVGLLAACVYFAACRLVLSRPMPHRAVPVVLGVAVLLRLIVMVQPPFLSSDLYRYLWDGRVQLAGVNPYRYVPADPALAGFRDTAVYPNIGGAEVAHTIYPPVAQMLFLAVARIGQTPLAMRLAMVAFEAVAVLALLRLMAAAGMNAARVAVYAWNPVGVWEFAGNGHVDAASIGLIALAVLACARRRPGLAGMALGAATLIKFLPLAVFPALWRRFDLRLPAAIGGVIVAGYACYSSAGRAMLGFLPNYVAEEHLDSGSGIYWLDALQHLMPLPAVAGRVWIALAVLALAGLSLWMAFLRPAGEREEIRLARGVAVMATAVILATTPHYTWYFAWLAWPSCIVPYASIIWLSVAPIVMYHDPFDDRMLQFSFIYLPFLVLALRDLRHPPSTARSL